MGLFQKSEMKVQGCFHFREGTGMHFRSVNFQGKNNNCKIFDMLYYLIPNNGTLSSDVL